MKLKNSYVLLIAMAIFLLVSVGSVCASEVSTNNTVELVDDGSDVVMDDDPVIDPSTPATPQKVNTTIVSDDEISINETANKTIDLTVNDNESKAITGITAKNLTVKEGTKTIKFDYNDSKIIIKDTLSLGKHNLLVSYLGNGNYTNSSKNIVLTIFGNYTIQAPSSVNVNSTRTVEVPINVTNGIDPKVLNKEDFNVTLTYKDGNVTKNISITDFRIVNNTVIFNYDLAKNITTSTITLVYNANESVKPKNVTLNRIYNVEIIPINTKNQYQNGNFTFKLVDLDNATENLTNKTVTISITFGSITTSFNEKTNENGIAIFKLNTYPIYVYSALGGVKNLEVGNHTVELSTSDNVKSTKLKTNLTIEQAKINIKIDPFKEQYSSGKNLTITVTNAENGDPVPYIILHLNIPEIGLPTKDYYIQTDANGQGKFGVTTIAGTYYLTASNNDTKNMAYKNVSTNFTVTPKPVKATVTTSTTISYNTGYTTNIKITDKTTGKGISGAFVLVKIYTGSKYTTYIFNTTKYGNAYFKTSLAVGSHKMEISSADSRYSFSKTVTLTVKKASAKISAPKVTAYYKSGKYFTIKLMNTKKSNAPIYAAKLNIRVYITKYSYYNYNGQTGVDGKIKLALDSLKPGTYKVEVRGADSKDFSVSKVTSQIVVKKAPTKLYPTKLVVKKATAKKGKTYFKVTVKNYKIKKVISGVKVKIKVYTGKKYKTYTVKTNSKGIAQLNVKSLSTGTHKVVVTSANKYCVAKAAASSIKITK